MVLYEGHWNWHSGGGLFVTMGSPWMVKLGAELIPRSPGLSHLLMALLHEDEFLSHSFHLLFQVCRDNGQIIQGLSEALDFNFQLFLKGVFIFKPLVREVGLEHSCCWKAVGSTWVEKGPSYFPGGSRRHTGHHQPLIH